MKSIIENLPHNTEAEISILSAIMNEPECYEEIKSILKMEYFFEPKHAILFRVIGELKKCEQPIDQISLYEKLKTDDLLETAGGVSYISKLTEQYISTANIGYQTKLVYEKYLLRQLIGKCKNIVKKAGKNEDVFDLLSEAGRGIEAISSEFNFSADREELFVDRLDKIFTDLEARSRGDKESEALRLKTLPSLNRIIGGIMPTDLIGIYGKEKSTKSTLAHEIALDLGADQKIPVCIFTFEHSKEESDWKTISMRTGIEFNKLRNPHGYNLNSKLTLEEIEILKKESYKRFAGSKILICDEVLDEYRIANKLRLWKKRHNIKLCVIDYLMLISSIERFQNRREELNHLSRFFKRLAMKLQIPIILISQANESGERAAESKGLERDANYFIYIRNGSEDGEQVHFNVPGYGAYTYRLGKNEFVATVRGIRHAAGNKSFVTKFEENRYVEVDCRPPALKDDLRYKDNWYDREENLPI